MVFTVAQVTSTFSVLYGLIVVQVISAFLFLWFDCCAFDKRVPWFYGLIVVQITSGSWFYGLIVAQVTSAFWFLWFDCGLSHKCVLGFMV